MMTFSYVIPTLNRYKKVIQSIEQIHDDPRIEEIVVCDDCSTDIEQLNYFKSRLSEFPKIRFFENEKNLGPFYNKLLGVIRSKSEWCICVDSDIYPDKDFLDKIQDRSLEKETCYKCSITPRFIKWNQYSGKTIKWGINMDMFTKNYGFFNSSNHVIHREIALQIYEKYKDCAIFYNDAMVFNYIWLIEGYSFYVVKDLYLHEYPDSLDGFMWKYKKQNIDAGEEVLRFIKSKNKKCTFTKSKRS